MSKETEIKCALENMWKLFMKEDSPTVMLGRKTLAVHRSTLFFMSSKLLLICSGINTVRARIFYMNFETRLCSWFVNAMFMNSSGCGFWLNFKIFLKTGLVDAIITLWLHISLSSQDNVLFEMVNTTTTCPSILTPPFIVIFNHQHELIYSKGSNMSLVTLAIFPICVWATRIKNIQAFVFWPLLCWNLHPCEQPSYDSSVSPSFLPGNHTCHSNNFYP